MISFALEGARLNAVVIAVIELKLSEYLTDKPMTASELAEAASISERGAQVIADAMVALKIWRVEDRTYSNTAVSEALLLPNSESYVGEQHPELFRLWLPIFQQATDLVTEGRPAHAIDSPETLNLWSVLTPVLARTGRAVAKTAIENLDLAHGQTDLLDVGGGGEALYSAALLSTNPEATATQIDWPHINDLAESAVGKTGQGARFRRIDGDFHDAPIAPESYDVVVISHILHQESFESTKDLLGRVFAGLRSGGHVVISDWIVDDGRTGPAPALLFNFTMLLLSGDGKSYERGEIFEALESQGFQQARTVAADSRTTLVFAQKP
jgi:SAM-dependent methyltransferase